MTALGSEGPRVVTCLGSGCRNASFPPFFRNRGKRTRLSKFVKALCRSSRHLPWFAALTLKLLLVDAEIVD